MTKFSWRAEGEESWNEADWPAEPERPNKGRGWLFVLLLVIVVGAAVFVVSRRVNKRVEEATDAVASDLFSSLNLARTALLQQDEELFAALLSGREKRWTETQLAMFRQGLFLDRAFVGLDAIMDGASLGPLESGDATVVSVEITPNLSEGQIAVSQPYQIMDREGGSRTIQLAHTFLFRKGSQRWLLSPPGEEYWGGRIQHEANFVTAFYPSRDADAAGSVVEALSNAIGQLCYQLLNEGCPPDLHLTLRFSTDPESLLAAADPEHALALHQAVDVPVIELMGVPRDDAGLEALQQAYGRLVLPAAFIKLAQWECCANAAIFGALLDNELSLLGVKPWPVSDGDYKRVALEGLDLNEAGRFWTSRDISVLNGQDGWKIYQLVDFLLRRLPNLSAGDMVAELAPERTFNSWLDAIFARSGRVFGDEPLMAFLDREWWELATEVALAKQSAAPIPLPQQELLLMCGTQDGLGEPVLLAYSPARDAWTQTPIGEGYFLAMRPVPGTQQLLFSSLVLDDAEQVERWQTLLRDQDGFAQEIKVGADALTLGQMDPSGTQLLMYAYGSNGEMPMPVLVDLSSCQQAGCSDLSLEGVPVWSPDGEYLIMTEAESLGQNPLVLDDRTVLLDFSFPNGDWLLWLDRNPTNTSTDASDRVALPVGFAPFWIDAESFGFIVNRVEDGGDSSEALMIGSVGDGSTIMAIDSEAIGAVLPAPQVVASRMGMQARWHLKAGIADPANPSQLVLALGTTAGEVIFYVRYDRDTGEITPLTTGRMRSGNSIAFSPSSRWLVIDSSGEEFNGPNGDGGQLVLLELATGFNRVYPTQMNNWLIPANHDWSADGQWLAILANDRAISLVAPEYDYQQILIRPTSSCSALAWAAP